MLQAWADHVGGLVNAAPVANSLARIRWAALSCPNHMTETEPTSPISAHGTKCLYWVRRGDMEPLISQFSDGAIGWLQRNKWLRPSP